MAAVESLSASQLQLYLTCSLKYRFQYVDKLPRLTVTANRAFGTAIHAALQWLHRERKAHRNPPLEEVLRVFDADWYAQTETAPRIMFDDEDAASALAKKGKELLSQYYHLPQPRPVRDAELFFTLPLVDPATGEVLDVPIRGVIDLVEEGAVVEFKAPQKAPPVADLPDNIQLTVYAYAHEMLFGKPPDEVRKIALVRTKTPKIETQVTGREKSDYTRLFAISKEVLKAIRTDLFIPNRGCWLCNDCEYEADCRDWAGNGEVVMT